MNEKINYYTVNLFKEGVITLTNGHTKATEMCQELVIIRTIRRQIERIRSSAELIIFYGSVYFDEQGELFQSAYMEADEGGLHTNIFIF